MSIAFEDCRQQCTGTCPCNGFPCAVPSACTEAYKSIRGFSAGPSWWGWHVDTGDKKRHLSPRGASQLTEILKGVVEVHVADGDDHGVAVLPPVEAALLQPLKVGGVPDLLLHQVLCTPCHAGSRCTCLHPSLRRSKRTTPCLLVHALSTHETTMPRSECHSQQEAA